MKPREAERKGAWRIGRTLSGLCGIIYEYIRIWALNACDYFSMWLKYMTYIYLPISEPSSSLVNTSPPAYFAEKYSSRNLPFVLFLQLGNWREICIFIINTSDHILKKFFVMQKGVRKMRAWSLNILNAFFWLLKCN